jgi:phosphatidylserine/phosphatidylglycerophosphate/cardiolipin synthase-like enzyme
MPKRKTVSKTQGGIVVLFMLVLVTIVGFFSQTGKSGSDTPATLPPLFATETPFQPGGNSPTSTPVVIGSQPSSTWWQVYFTDPLTVNDPANWQNSIEGRLIDRINAAQTSIHIASFEFDLTPVAEALIAAHNRGVDVRWVTDDESGLIADEEPGRGQFAMLQNAGVEVRSDNRTALMHNKFWIFDNQITWTGSTNITENGVFKQDNNTIVIESPALATIYEREFQEMWDGQFGPKSPSQLPDQSTVVNGTPINVIFTSEDHALEEAIIPLVGTATSNIRFLAFSFTDYPLAAAMIERAQNGVDVAGVFEKVGSDTASAELKTLYCAHVPVRRDGNGSFMHNKVIVVDQRYVVTGSLNFSTNAETSNDENVIIIDNPEIAKLYMQDFERVWNQATDPEPDKFPCQ